VRPGSAEDAFFVGQGNSLPVLRAPAPVGAFCFLGLVSSAVLLGSLVSPSAGRIRNLGKSFSVAPCGTYPDPVGSTASFSQQEEKGQGLNTENTENTETG